MIKQIEFKGSFKELVEILKQEKEKANEYQKSKSEIS